MTETARPRQVDNPFFTIFKSILRLLGHIILSALRPHLRIVDDEPNLLTLDSNCYTVVASRDEGIVTLDGQTVAVFKSIEAIHIRHFVSGAGNRRREWWTLSLKTARRPIVDLGRTQDSLEASIAAARLSTLIDRPVVAFSQTGLGSSVFEA